MMIQYCHLCVSWEAVVDMATWVAHACDWTEWRIFNICQSPSFSLLIPSNDSDLCLCLTVDHHHHQCCWYHLNHIGWPAIREAERDHLAHQATSPSPLSAAPILSSPWYLPSDKTRLVSADDFCAMSDFNQLPPTSNSFCKFCIFNMTDNQPKQVSSCLLHLHVCSFFFSPPLTVNLQQECSSSLSVQSNLFFTNISVDWVDTMTNPNHFPVSKSIDSIIISPTRQSIFSSEATSILAKPLQRRLAKCTRPAQNFFNTEHTINSRPIPVPSLLHLSYISENWWNTLVGIETKYPNVFFAQNPSLNN